MKPCLNDTPGPARGGRLGSAAGVTRLLMVCLSIPAIITGALLAAVFMPCAYVLGYRMRYLPRVSGRPPRGGTRVTVGSRVTVATALAPQRSSRLLG